MNSSNYMKLYKWLELGGVSEFLSSHGGDVFGLNGFLYVLTPQKILSELIGRLKIQDEDIVEAIAVVKKVQVQPITDDSGSELEAVCNWLQECHVDKDFLWPDDVDMECVSRSISAFCSLCSGTDGRHVILSCIAYLNLCLELELITQSPREFPIKYIEGMDGYVSSAVKELGRRVSSLDIYAVVRVIRSGVLDALNSQRQVSINDNFISRFSVIVNGFMQRGFVSSPKIASPLGRREQYVGVFIVTKDDRKITIITPPTFAKKAVKLHFLNALIDSGFIERLPATLEIERVQRPGHVPIYVYRIREAILSIVRLFSRLAESVRRRVQNH